MANRLPLNRGPGGNNHPIPVKQFILDRLALVGEDYFSSLHQSYKKALEQLARERRREYHYHKPVYSSFYKKVKDLIREGLVEYSGRVEPVEGPRFSTWDNPPLRRYVRLARR